MKRLPNQPEWFERRLDLASQYDAMHCTCGRVFAWPKDRVPPEHPAQCPDCKAIETVDDGK